MASHLITSTLQTQLDEHIRQFQVVIIKLQPRLMAVERCRRIVQSELPDSDLEDDEDDSDAMLDHIDALASDLATYIEQLKARVAHVERGISMIQALTDERAKVILQQYILDDIKMWLRDSETARLGYDELINNITSFVHHRDQ